MNLLFVLFLFAIAIYVLYAAITGKGRLYSAEFIKESMKEKFRKVMRLMYLALGIVMLLEAATMAGQQYLFKADNYVITSSYYDENGFYHKIEAEEVEDKTVYYESVVYLTTVDGEEVETIITERAPAKTYSEIDDVGLVIYDEYDSAAQTAGEQIAFTENPYPEFVIENGQYYFVETYYDASGVRHKITESDGAYTEKIASADAIPVTTYTEAEFIEQFEYNSSNRNARVLNVTLTDPNSDGTTETTSASSSDSCMSMLSCMGTSSTATSTIPTVGSEMVTTGVFLPDVSYETYNVLSIVFMSLSLAILVALFIVVRLMTDKEKKNRARTTNSGGQRMPSSAFEFDEDDKQQ